MLFAGAGAVRFAREEGHEEVSTEQLRTDKAQTWFKLTPEYDGSQKLDDEK